MAVVGVGYFGSLHAEKIARLAGAKLIAVADRNLSRAEELGTQFGVRFAVDYRDLLGEVDAVSVAVPTSLHFEVAKTFLENGIHVLVEKPITETVANAKELIELTARRGVVFQVGHLERFSSAIVAIREKIVLPLYIESYRIAPFKPRGTDVNVILDLMIHDIDLLLFLVGAPISSIEAIGAPVLSNSEDVANARLRFENGCVATITASRVGAKTERKMRIFQPDSYISVDFLARSVTAMRRTFRPTDPDTPDITVESSSYEEVDELEREIEAFVKAVNDREPPAVTGEDGLKALEAAIMISRSLEAHAELVRQKLETPASPADQRSSSGAMDAEDRRS